jgi:hypothetical protein
MSWNPKTHRTELYSSFQNSHHLDVTRLRKYVQRLRCRLFPCDSFFGRTIFRLLSKISFTLPLNVYAHLMKGENQEAACRLENTIFEGTGHNLVTKEEKGLTVNG